MDFDYTTEQSLLLTALDSLAEPHERSNGHCAHWLDGTAIERELEANGFYEVCSNGLGDGVLLIERMARLPQAVEVGASTLIRPLLGELSLPRPFALASRTLHMPIRFLDRAATVIIDDGEHVYAIPGSELEIQAVASPYGYPFGIAGTWSASRARRLALDAGSFRARWRLSLAAEIAGAAAAGIAHTVRYVNERCQFGKPLAAFQAIQHRLAECQVSARSAYLLALRAASSGIAADAHMAAAFAQKMSARIHYDIHQFHGAIGLTLEYPIHLWTQRLKALQGELGGASSAALEAASGMAALRA